MLAGPGLVPWVSLWPARGPLVVEVHGAYPWGCWAGPGPPVPLWLP